MAIVPTDTGDENDKIIEDGTGRCQEFVATGHHCSGCGYDPDDYCKCWAFQLDNLKYVESHAKKNP